MFNKESLYLKLIYIIFIFIDSISLPYCLWVEKTAKVLFLISTIILIIINIFSLIYIYIKIDLDINLVNSNKCQRLILNLFIFFNVLLIPLIEFCRILLNISINLPGYDEYLKDCPFTLLYNETHHEDRVCQLYNIYNNSRYKYRYICSYNAFNYQKNPIFDNLDIIKCIPKLKNINNNIINKFSKIYNNKQLFYCSRINKPKKNNYIKDEYWNKKVNIPTLFFFIHFIYYALLCYQVKILLILNNLYLQYIGLNEEQSNNFNSEASTQYIENNINNISFNKEADKNIIVENNEVYNIEVSIKHFAEMKENKKNNE